MAFSLMPASGDLELPANSHAQKQDGAAGVRMADVPPNLRCMGIPAAEMRARLRRESDATEAMLAESARNALHSAISV